MVGRKYPLLLLCAGIIFALATEARAQECKRVQLPWHPFTASYLPKYRGYLTEFGGDSNQLEALGYSNYLEPQQVRLYQSTSVMERIDRAIASVLGENTNFYQYAKTEFYNPDALTWEGYCDRWAAASLNPTVDLFVDSVELLVCGDVLLSQMELEEVMSGFYPTEPQEFHGIRVNREMTENDFALLTHSGFDDLQPADFVNRVVENIRDKFGVVMDLKTAFQVWNYPIFGANHCEYAPVSARAYYHQNPDRPFTARMVFSADSGILAFLKDLNDIERQMVSNLNGVSELTYLEAMSRIKLKLEDLAPHAGTAVPLIVTALAIPEYPAFRAMVRQIQQNWIREGKIVFKEGLTAERVRLDLDYRTERSYGHFVRPQTERYTRQQTFEFLIIRDGSGAIVESFWATPAEQRPDFMWIPRRFEIGVEPGSLTYYLMELLDACVVLPPEFTLDGGS